MYPKGRGEKRGSMVVVSMVLAAACGGKSGTTPVTGGQGSYSWSVTQTNTSGAMVSCVNYTNQKVTATQAMMSVQGGTVSAAPCPMTASVIGVCSGVDSGGNSYQQVFYNDSGLAGSAYAAGVQNLMLACAGTWTSGYDGMFSVATGAGGSGGQTAGTGGTTDRFAGIWTETGGSATQDCGAGAMTNPFTMAFDLEFEVSSAGHLDLLTLDQNDAVMAGSCPVTYVESGSTASLNGAQSCAMTGNTVTWTADVFTLSSDGASMDEVGASQLVTNTQTCMNTVTIHYTRKPQSSTTAGATGCALCDKAGACCAAATGSASACSMYSAAKCNAQPASTQATYVLDICQSLLTAEASSDAAACH